MTMFEINWTNAENMFAETQACFHEIDGIDELLQFQNRFFNCNNDDVCFGDSQIDGLEYPPQHDRLTVYIQYSNDNGIAHYVIDFYEPEIHYFDIEFNTHWIDDVVIQKNTDGKFSISFGSGECDFRYKFARVNRCWVDAKE